MRRGTFGDVEVEAGKRGLFLPPGDQMRCRLEEDAREAAISARRQTC